MVSSQLYFTINLEEIFYFNDKKYRIYAVFGVSQTPIEIKQRKGEQILCVKMKQLQPIRRKQKDCPD